MTRRYVALLTRVPSRRVADRYPGRRRCWPVLLTAALVMAACGDADDASDASDADRTTEAVSSDDEDATEDVASDASGSDDDLADDEGQVRDVGLLTAEDGWIELHDHPLPEPGQLRLEIGGEDLLIDNVVCGEPGIVSDPESWDLFHFAFRTTDGVTSDGLPVWVSGSRRIVTEQRAEEEAFYDYVGQERTTVQIDVQQVDDTYQSSITVSPSDWDPSGTELPLVHVDPSGAFTVDAEIRKPPMFHDDALAGPTVIAGRCQEGWPEDVD